MAAKRKGPSALGTEVRPQSSGREIRKLRKQVKDLVHGIDSLVTLWDRIILPHQNAKLVAKLAGCEVQDLVRVKDIREYWVQIAALVVSLEVLGDSAAQTLKLPMRRLERVAKRDAKLRQSGQDIARIAREIRLKHLPK